jgi:uncharacterized protein (DUF697 family)
MPTNEGEVDHMQAQVRERIEGARGIVRKNVMWAMGAGVIPLPVVDVAAISAVQLKMLRQLGTHYDVAFREHRVKSLVGSLIGGLGSFGLGALAVMSLSKLIPVVGQAAGSIALPIAGGAVTHALGQVFIQHFETGGTFFTFDPEAMREHFRSEFAAAKETVKSYTAE